MLEFGEIKDINGRELFNELVILSEIIDEIPHLLKFLKKYHITVQMIYISNVSIILRILLTMPITTVSAESAFSKLKLIKNYLRSTLSQEKVTNLAIISIES